MDQVYASMEWMSMIVVMDIMRCNIVDVVASLVSAKSFSADTRTVTMGILCFRAVIRTVVIFRCFLSPL